MHNQARYTRTAIALHWVMALLLLGMLGVGTWMTELRPSPIKIQVYNWHKWIGLSLLGLLALRLAWRATHRAPALPAGLPGWQRVAAGLSHAVMYLLMLAMPVTGWLQNSAAGFPLSWFGLFRVPALIPRDREAFAFWQAVHAWLAWALLLLILLHVIAALKHHFLDRDEVLRRMLPWGGPRSTSRENCE